MRKNSKFGDGFFPGGAMKVENDVPTIFNPRKPRLSQSNAVLTSDHRPYGPFSHVLSRSESRKIYSGPCNDRKSFIYLFIWFFSSQCVRPKTWNRWNNVRGGSWAYSRGWRTNVVRNTRERCVSKQKPLDVFIDILKTVKLRLKTRFFFFLFLFVQNSRNNTSRSIL